MYKRQDESINPVRDKETIDIELQIKDLESVEKKIESTKKKTRTGDKEAAKHLLILEKYHHPSFRQTF